MESAQVALEEPVNTAPQETKQFFKGESSKRSENKFPCGVLKLF